ncbi:Putative metallopeptidase [Roseibium denhamense]|uniref:Metallopeptidase n=2 Tax=Roseibium denhamense TaxID=76305 RepID=A0ABY1NWL0_9HYPH|nr:Putative metallopeptidase [Roseibium denhamense]
MKVTGMRFSLGHTACRLTALAAVALLILVQAAFASNQDEATPYLDIDAELEQLSSEDLEELLVFVAGNTLFTLYHEAGHMLVSELALPVLAQEEDAVDNLATVSMLETDTEDMDLLLTNAMVGWFLIAEDTYENLIFYNEHDLDEQRGYRMLCLMVGADEEVFLELAQDLGLPDERIETCAFDYEQASDSWAYATDPYIRDSDTPAGKIEVVYDPAPQGLSLLEIFLKESELMEQVAEEFDTFYDLPEQVTFRAAECGMENAFWDPNIREMTLCHELMGGFAAIYLDVLASDQ